MVSLSKMSSKVLVNATMLDTLPLLLQGADSIVTLAKGEQGLRDSRGIHGGPKPGTKWDNETCETHAALNEQVVHAVQVLDVHSVYPLPAASSRSSASVVLIVMLLGEGHTAEASRPSILLVWLSYPDTMYLQCMFCQL